MTNETNPPSSLPLASPRYRFVAWGIDVLVVSVILGIDGGPLRIVALIQGSFLGPLVIGDVGVVSELGLFVYWGVIEGLTGRSAGKMLLNLRLVDADGGDVGLVQGIVQGFGKAFFLPIDCLLGLAFYRDRRLRLFNRLSETVVVDTSEDPDDVVWYDPSEA